MMSIRSLSPGDAMGEGRVILYAAGSKAVCWSFAKLLDSKITDLIVTSAPEEIQYQGIELMLKVFGTMIFE